MTISYIYGIATYTNCTMKRSHQGHYETTTTAGEKVNAFVPAPLPPMPPIVWSPELRTKFDEALIARAITPEIEQQFQQAGLGQEEIMPLFRTAYYATYVVVGFVTLFYQGAMARYYHRRTATVAADLA